MTKIINIEFFIRIKKGFLWVKEQIKLYISFLYSILSLIIKFLLVTIIDLFLRIIKGRWILSAIRWVVGNPLLIAILLLITIGFFLRGLMLKQKIIYEGNFLENVIAEIHGLLFDIFVFGIIIVIFNKIFEKRVLGTS